MSKTKTKAEGDAAKLAQKAKKGTTHLALLLDESGSMNGNQEAVITSVNEFLVTFGEAETKRSKIKVWLGMFDWHPGEPRLRIKVDGVRVKDVKQLGPSAYTPRGRTPLNDAVLETIGEMDKSVKKGERAFIVILTDGLENASEAEAEAVARAIKQREKAGWAFLYLGANHNAVAAAQNIGLSKSHALQFNSTPKGTSASVRRTTDRAASYLASSSAEGYALAAAADWQATGGKVVEDDEDKDA